MKKSSILLVILAALVLMTLAELSCIPNPSEANSEEAGSGPVYTMQYVDYVE